jgi:hypothetical protein
MAHALDSDLGQLREAVQRIGQNLVDLELDSSRQLLEASTLVGESATRWAAASAALTQLWRWNGLLEEFVKRAEQLRGDELRNQLYGSSIELDTSEVPIESRDLLGSSEVTLRCTPRELLARMSSAFDEAKTVIAVIGRAWQTLTPPLDAAGRVLADCTRLVGELGDAQRAELESAAGQMAALRRALSEDPLSVAAADINLLTSSLQELHRELESEVTLKRELDSRIAGARELAVAVRNAVEQAQAAHEEVVIKISVPAVPEPPRMPERVEAELTEIRTLADGGRWRDAQRRLEQLTASAEAMRDEAQRVLAANRAPIEARNQYRALLDAYQVKAKRLGFVEEPELADIYTQARDALYTAPTDLSLVGQLVRRYQEAMR